MKRDNTIECERFFSYKNDEELELLYQDDWFCVVFGTAEDMNKKSIGIRWIIDKKGDKNPKGYPYERYVRLPWCFSEGFLQTILVNKNPSGQVICKSENIEEAIKYFKNLKD